MGRESPCPEEFGKDAVALCRAAAGKRTYAVVAADLGITAESLRTWVREDDSQAVPGHREAGGSEAEGPARLRVGNARLLKAEKGRPGPRRRPPHRQGAPSTARPPSPVGSRVLAQVL